MAEEALYGSESAMNKRKYEDNTPPSAGRRQTGFSAPISSHSPPDASAVPPAYNSVPPPMDEIQLAKQKAQEIAARLVNNAEAVKRPRVDDGDSNNNLGQRPINVGVTPPVMGSYGYPGPSKKIEIPNARVGVIIGKGGETIKYLQVQSGAKIQVTRDMDADPNSLTRGVELMGTAEQIAKAEQLINDVLAEADSGGSGIVSRRITGQVSGAQQFVMKVPNNKVGLVIGKGGETIKSMQATSGARIQVIPLHLPPGDTSAERTLQIDGSSEQIEAAKQLVNEVISENRVRNPAMGGYPQQGYQARPPTSWAPPGAPMQQPGYGYMPPGSYPGQPQYNMSQPPYTGFPQTTSGGYATGWDQTTGQPNQQTTQGGGYDYYSQQPPQHQQAPAGSAAPTDNAVYGYNQPPASGYSQGQGYGQDGYGGYHAPGPQSGYGQPQLNPIPGYDQQGYNSTSGYGNVSNPTPDGHTPTQGDANQAPPPTQSSAMGQQGYSTGQLASPNPSYPSQGSTQSGYAMPPTSQGGYGVVYGPPQGQKPPTSQPPYGQPQLSPSAQGSYPQPSPSYPSSQPPPAQSGYAQPEAGAQRPPSSGYGAPTAQPGYGAPPYGAAPLSQPGYGQQHQTQYSAVYSGGYSQPPAYGDGYTQPPLTSGGGGNARVTYDAPPASQSSQPAKASPQS